MTREDFLKNLYAYCEGTIELRALPSRHRQFYAIDNHKAINAFCRQNQRENVYFAVATRDGGGTKEHIKDIPSLWIDIDFKDVDRDKARRAIDKFLLKPSAVVRSGGGYHVYWKLNEPAQYADIRDIELLNRALARILFGDLQACDASRILRLPDTKNFKYSPPAEVDCAFCDPTIEYDLSDVQEALSLCLDNHNEAFAPSQGAKGASNADAIYNNTTDYNGGGRKKLEGIEGVCHVNFQEGHRDHTIFHVANCLTKGGMTDKNIRQTLQVLGKACNPPFPERELESKIKSALDREGRYDRTHYERIMEFLSVTARDFSVTDVYQDLGMVTVRDKAACRKALVRCLGRGIIERRGKRRGYYRKIQNDCEDIDYKNAVVEVLDIKWPFQLENMVDIMPKNIIVVAGEPNVGKTAFLLNVVDMNIGAMTKKMPIYYFSSEMGGPELRKRLEYFPYRVLSEWDFHPKERSSDFSDVIRPDAVNIIDYLEVHENFFEVGGMIKAIYDRLNRGIAIIGLQKNKLTDYGLGGLRSLEKPRLYLAMSGDFPDGKLKIVKGKNWHTETNPANYAIKFKLLRGCQFIEQGKWTLDYEQPVGKK